jgi:hypothetical protein
MYWVLGTDKLISNSCFFPCLLLSAERQAHGPLVHYGWLKKAEIPNAEMGRVRKQRANVPS